MSELLDLFRILLKVESEKDSLEIGAPSKGGVVKIYGSLDDPEAFHKKIDIALQLREFARAKIEAGIMASFDKSAKAAEGSP